MAFGDACSLVNSRTSLTLSLFNLMLNSGAYRFVFALKNMNGFISEFGLTYKQTCLLFSLERQIIVNDIINTKANNKPEEAIRKQTWLDAWTDNINNFLEGLNKKEKKNEECECPVPSSKPDIAKIDNNNLLEEILQEENSVSIKAWRYLILLECTLFTPYYTLDNKEINNENFIDKVKNIFNGLSLNEETQKNSLVNIAELLEIDFKYIDIFRKRYQESLRSLSRFWTRVLLAGGTGMIVAVAIVLFFINPIAAAFAAPGLVGAAAFSAGMAALGGGAIAAGGFGIAGGIAVLVGGALVLGGSTGMGIGALASATPQIVLTELAKIEVVLKEIVLGIQHDVKTMQEIILKLNDNLAEMQREVTVLKLENKKNEDKIKNLMEAIEYLTKAIDEFQKLK